MITDGLFPKMAAKKYLHILDRVEAQNTSLLHLTANENTMSNLAMRFYTSSMGLRYDFGRGSNGIVSVDFFGNFAAATYPELHDIFDTASKKAKKMLSAKAINLHCLSGAHAMLCSLIGSSTPGDTIMSVKEEDGGHFCTKKIIEAIGRKHVFASYNNKELTFDVKKTAQDFIRAKAKILYLDTSVLLRPHPIRELRSALPKSALIIYDASHTLGLIMGGEFQSPLLEGADIISANTHKTFPGPHKGLLAFRTQEIGNKVDAVIQNTLYSTFHTNNLLALAISIIEYDTYGQSYARQIIKNSNTLAKSLESNGLKIRKVNTTHYSFNHQVHLFVNANPREVVRIFLRNGISVTTSDALGGNTFIRIGTQEITKRGMKEQDMVQLATFITRILQGENLLREVSHFNSLFQTVQYCFPSI